MKNSLIGPEVLCLVNDIVIVKHMRKLFAHRAIIVRPNQQDRDASRLTEDLIASPSIVILEWEVVPIGVFNKVAEWRNRDSVAVALCPPTLEYQVAALRNGCDCVATIPICDDLLMAQIIAFQRSHGIVSEYDSFDLSLDSPTVTTPGDTQPLLILYDRNKHECVIHSEFGVTSTRLSLKEHEILNVLTSVPGRCSTKDELFDLIWGYSFDTNTNIIESSIYSLRKRLRKAGANEVIENVRGAGYRILTERVSISIVN